MSERRGCIVPGRVRGIGDALTRAWLEEGHCVAASGRGEERLSALADAAVAGGRLTTSVANAGDWADTERVVELCADRYGRIDGVSLISGSGGHRGSPPPVHQR